MEKIINCQNKSKEEIKNIIKNISNKSLIIFPTETVYGIGTFISNIDGIKKIYELKGRSEHKPLSLHIINPNEIKVYTDCVSEYANKVIKEFLPGPLLMIFKKRKDYNFPINVGTIDKIGIRVFDHIIGELLINQVGEPLVATSANISNTFSHNDFNEIPKELIDGVDYAFYDGKTKYQIESTVVDFSDEIPILLREGAISFETLSKKISIKK